MPSSFTIKSANLATWPEAKRKEIEVENNQAGEYDADELKAAFKKYGIVSPDGKPVSDPFPFNLMFSTTIGPGDGIKGYVQLLIVSGIKRSSFIFL